MFGLPGASNLCFVLAVRVILDFGKVISFASSLGTQLTPKQGYSVMPEKLKIETVPGGKESR